MKELDEFIDKTASSLKNIFIKYFDKKKNWSEVELLKIKTIFEVYNAVLEAIEKKHDLTEYKQGNKKIIFIENCYVYIYYHSIILKEFVYEFIKEYIENEH